jgi:hypothetical protein
MQRALNNDKIFTTKLGVKLGEVFDRTFLQNSYLITASTEASSNFNDQSFLKHKFFTRYTQSYKSA